MPPRINRLAFALTVALILLGAGHNEFAVGQAVFTGFGFLTLTAWLVRYDVVTRTIRRPGQPRFSAICMMGGYAWLAGAGMMLLVKAPDSATFSYDVAIHAVTVGFVLSMLFGHAPTILPAVTGVRVRIDAHVYAPRALLHLSLLLRIVGDFTEWISLRATSGLLTVLSLAGYGGLLIATTYTKRAGKRSRGVRIK